MSNADSDAMFHLVRFGVIAIFLLPVIATIAAAKREVAFDLIATAITLDAAWEVQAIVITVALMIFLAIPTWGLLLRFYRDTT